jgi:Zn-dependent protease
MRLPSLDILLPSLAVLVLSLSFHEAAHAWMANRLGDPTARMLGRLTLNPLAHIDWIGTVLFPLIAMSTGLPIIGWAKPVPVDVRHFAKPREGFAIVALAGPVSNLILAAIAVLVWKLLPSSGIPSWIAPVTFYVIGINVLLAVFNMIPIPPLDGGNVLMGLVPAHVASAIGWLRPYGFLILYALMILGVLGQIMRPIQRAITMWLLL